MSKTSSKPEMSASLIFENSGALPSSSSKLVTLSFAEEINFDLNISFQCSWCNCDRFGFIKKSRVVNNSPDTVTLKLLDGIQNILPAEIDRKLQLEYSTLIDGYKKSEFHADMGLAAYMLSSILTDKAEPSESLRANTVWSSGLGNAKILLSTSQLDKFRADQSLDHAIIHGFEHGYVGVVAAYLGKVLISEFIVFPCLVSPEGLEQADHVFRSVLPPISTLGII